MCTNTLLYWAFIIILEQNIFGCFLLVHQILIEPKKAEWIFHSDRVRYLYGHKWNPTFGRTYADRNTGIMGWHAWMNACLPPSSTCQSPISFNVYAVSLSELSFYFRTQSIEMWRRRTRICCVIDANWRISSLFFSGGTAPPRATRPSPATRWIDRRVSRIPRR